MTEGVSQFLGFCVVGAALHREDRDRIRRIFQQL
jgi:hypothetical protein